MPLPPDIDAIVERLEASYMPRLADFGRSLSRSHPHVVAETFSHRHATVVHCLGLCCYPVGADSHDPRTVALIVNVTAISKPSMNGYVTWQVPLSKWLHSVPEGETAVYDAFGEREFATFAAELDGLLNVLAAAVQRGVPLVVGHNPPMQRAGAAGIFSGVGKWFGRGPGR
ncbi:MAG TPA: hypothetical protein VF796_23565 [Humisphaera sp.]